jgi:hypothetical protein
MPRNVGYKNTRRMPKVAKKNGRRKPVKKNPYRAKNKKAVSKMIQPIAEGRKLSFINTTSPRALGPTVTNENWYVIVPETWDHMYRENYLDTLPTQPSSKGFTGKTLFSRYLNQKIKVRFDTIRHYAQPVTLHVVYGWCKIPYVTTFQSQGSDSARNTNGVLIQHDREQMITRALSQMYNVMFPVTDPKQFKLLYNREFQVRGETTTGKDFSGQAPVDIEQTIRKDLDYRITWRPNTKYHMTPATLGDGSDGNPPPGNDLSPDDGFAQFETTQIPNTTAYWTPSSKKNGDLWTPFFAIQVKNASVFGKNAQGQNDILAYPLVYQQNSHYFYDM